MKDEIKRKYLESQGLTLITIQECDFIKNIEPKCLHLYEFYLPPYYITNKGKLSFQQIVTDIKSDRLFGAVEVDITIEEGYEKISRNIQLSFVPAILLPNIEF